MPAQPHAKHGTTVKPSTGQYARQEWAIIGAPCSVIQALAEALSAHLSGQWEIAYLDADHAAETEAPKPAFALRYTDQIKSHRLEQAGLLSDFDLRQWLHRADAALINGNHFTGQRQIVIIDPAKQESLARKLDRLTNVSLILLQDGQESPWPFLVEHLQGSAVPVLPLRNTAAIAQWLAGQLQAATPALQGLVLAGGRSTRMGRDKGLMQYHNKPQREYMADLLAPLCKEVFISCRPEQAAEIQAPYRPLPDTFHDLGPYGALLSAFRAYPDSAWMIVACDLPLLNAHTLQFLYTHRNPSRIATAFQSPDNAFPEPLIAIWEPKAYPTLLQFLAQGYSCPRKVLIQCHVQLLTAPDSKALTNVNTPEEAAALLHSGHSV